jgi:hypothetical protein
MDSDSSNNNGTAQAILECSSNNQTSLRDRFLYSALVLKLKIANVKMIIQALKVNQMKTIHLVQNSRMPRLLEFQCLNF